MPREKILELVKDYYRKEHQKQKFYPGKDFVRYAGRFFNEDELVKLVDSSLEFWLTEGRYCEEFSGKISEFLDIENVILTNSGSSANLLAFSALTSNKLGDRRLKPGDEVISVAAAFPATVAPVVQNGMVPVFVDIDLPTYNINISSMKEALSDKTRCIFIAHTLGNPFNISEVMKFAEENNLWVIEDNCDAFGSKYENRYTGTFGHLSTMSFYPAHHITTGEGGAVVTGDKDLARIVTSFRDWGRDCYCSGGKNDTCGGRFSGQFGSLPYGYDHKYVYSELGYNLKMTDMQASVGSAQMDKISFFCERRKENYKMYNSGLKKFNEYFILPEAEENSDPAWFSYILTVREDAPFQRNDIVKFLNSKKIETRNIFAGNIIRQPAFYGIEYRIATDLSNTDFVMNNTFFMGTYPGMTEEMIEYVISVIGEFVESYKYASRIKI